MRAPSGASTHVARAIGVAQKGAACAGAGTSHKIASTERAGQTCLFRCAGG